MANNTVAAALASPEGNADLGNGWKAQFLSVAGNFSDDYIARRYTTDRLYLELVPDLARYPAYTLDTVGPNQNLEIGTDEAYLMRFSSKPPVKGFWIVTAYDENQFLIPNGIDTWSLGTASNLIHPEGTCAPNKTKAGENADDEFDILLQPADIWPPSNWMGDWLPAPLGGGQFSINLRWCGPEEQLMNGSMSILS